MTSLRNQVLVEFMLTSGCRVGEVNGINREDVNLESRSARVVGKGKKIRHVHFTDKCAVLLERYLKTSRMKTSPALFVSATTGKRLSIRMIQKIVNEIGKGAGITTGLHPHRLRHTFATELLAKGADLSFIGDEMGHSDIGTTQIYARIPNREIVALYRKFMG
jgi:integrase/recombinase XerD